LTSCPLRQARPYGLRLTMAGRRAVLSVASLAQTVAAVLPLDPPATPRREISQWRARPGPGYR
jgi:hypothetical protein